MNYLSYRRVQLSKKYYIYIYINYREKSQKTVRVISVDESSGEE